MREYYLGSSSHTMKVQIYDFVSSTWEDYFSFVGQSGMTILTVPIFDPTDHINGGNVSVRLNHVQNGITSHRLYIDYIWLINGNNIGSSTNLDGYAKYNFGSNNFTGTGNFTTTNTGFFGWIGSLINRVTKLWVQDIDVNNTIQMNRGNITNSSYIIMNEITGGCNLRINHSICSNATGTYLVG
jgi:hypothetical protein